MPISATQKNIESIVALEEAALHELTFGERLSMQVADVAGRPRFIVLHAAAFAGWCVANAGVVPEFMPFDPFPFNLLNLIVSLEAIFLALFLLMNQSIMTRQADRRAHLGLQISLLAEQEATGIIEMIRRLCDHLGVHLDDVQKEIAELAAKTVVEDVVGELEDKLSKE